MSTKVGLYLSLRFYFTWIAMGAGIGLLIVTAKRADTVGMLIGVGFICAAAICAFRTRCPKCSMSYAPYAFALKRTSWVDFGMPPEKCPQCGISRDAPYPR